MNEITKMVLVTTIICIFSAVLLGGLKQGLKARIEQQEDMFIRGPAIHALLDQAPNDPLADKIIFSMGTEQISIYPWIEEGTVRRVALEQAGAGGYGGEVTVMTAVDLETDRVYGVQVTQHKETPGVGTRVMEPAFLANFVKLPITSEIALKKNGGQIDAVSGATKTSTAVADSVNRSARLVRENKDKIRQLILGKAG